MKLLLVAATVVLLAAVFCGLHYEGDLPSNGQSHRLADSDVRNEEAVREVKRRRELPPQT